MIYPERKSVRPGGSVSFYVFSSRRQHGSVPYLSLQETVAAAERARLFRCTWIGLILPTALPESALLR